jgi:EAL and modified HD-GYP domain-containing signal transduction protein
MAGDAWLIGRQPILDRTGTVWGYELLFRSARSGGANSADVKDASFATANVILGALSGFGMAELLGGHRGFVNVGRDLLFSESVEILPRDQVVLELLENVEPSHAVVQRCRGLKAAGFSVALDDHAYDPAYEELYRIVDLVKIDLMATQGAALELTLERMRAFPVAVLAEKVETPEQFKQCLDLGFHYFQGYHFARPAVLQQRRIDEAGGSLLKVLRLLTEDADTRVIEGVFRESPGLTYKLLVLVNSVSFGSRERISTVRQAITMLGRAQMRRWLQLALFATDDRRGLDDPLVDMAAVRASFMEGLARLHPQLERTPDAAEQAFMTGVLSLLDRIFSISMPEVVERLRLSEAIAQALEQRAGPLGELLLVAERLEALDMEGAWSHLAAAGIARERAFAALRLAFAWKAATR